MARVGIFGAGWVGLVTGFCLAELGHEVVVRDIVAEKIAALDRGEVPFHEDGLAELLERNRVRLSFTERCEDLTGCQFLFVCVDTPPTQSGDADLSRVWRVIDELPPLEERAIVVMKSTVPVGTGEKVRHGLDQRGLAHIGYVSNPEFLAEGTAVRDFMQPDRIAVGASDDADGDAVAALYEGLEAPVVRSDVKSAEMIKLAANAFLMTRISFINEIANVCEVTGADVVKVAQGIGLDKRLGPHFLRAGIGYGGSCLVGSETVLARLDDRTWLTSLEALYDDLAGQPPRELEVLSWSAEDGPIFMPVAAVTRRRFTGELIEVRTKMGRRISCTPDHPFVTGKGVVLAEDLSEHDWLPVAIGPVDHRGATFCSATVLAGLGAAGLTRDDVIVRAPQATSTVGVAQMRCLMPDASPGRRADIRRSGTLRLNEAETLSLDLYDASVGTARNGTYVPTNLAIDECFWRVVGLYLAEGHCAAGGRRRRLQWSFHPHDERDLVDEVAGYWESRGIKASVWMKPTSMAVSVSSRLLAAWWTDVLGAGRNSYDHRIPDLVWNAPESHKRALLAALWRGDGSWSLVAGGPSVVLEYGTVSRALADGMLRLLGEVGIVARLKVGRTAKSTVDTYWLVISGAHQVEQLLELIKPADRTEIEESLARQERRIAPTGYRVVDGATWVRVVDKTRRFFDGPVYSVEIPGPHTFVTTGGLVVHNCFPKDSLALKQLASNSGYHFQLLAAVIEVNDLQKRRVISKLKRHLGSLRGAHVALLGLAFKPGTDDMREAPSIVLAARLVAEGAIVRGWDPVADGSLLAGVTQVATIAEAVAGAHAAVIVTEWPELAALASPEVREAMARPLIIDGRNMLDPATVRAAGFEYEGIGRPAGAELAGRV